MADSKNDSKKIHTTEDSSKTRPIGDWDILEKSQKPQSFQRLPYPPEADAGQGQQESGGRPDETDTTSNDGSTSKPDTTSSDSSTETDKK